MKKFNSKTAIREKSFVDEVIEEFGGIKISYEDAMERFRNLPESDVGSEMYAELHPESVIIKKHNKELADECKFKPKSKNCEYKNYWEKCAYCNKEFSR